MNNTNRLNFTEVWSLKIVTLVKIALLSIIFAVTAFVLANPQSVLAAQCYEILNKTQVDTSLVGDNPEIQCRDSNRFYSTNRNAGFTDGACTPRVRSAPPAMCGIEPAVDCVGSWGRTPGATCSATCGGGTIQQTYTVSVPASGGGASCPFADGATRNVSCNNIACTPDPEPEPEPEPDPEPDPAPTPTCGGYWYNSGSCSATCGGGIQQQRYYVTSGGGSCARSPRYVSCNTNSCPNVPPEVYAGPPFSIVSPDDSVSVTEATATDEDGSIQDLNWSYVSGPTTYNILNGDTENPDINSLTEIGDYTFRFSATDNDGDTSSDELTISVTAPPDLGVTSPSVNEQNPDPSTGEYATVDIGLAIRNLAPAGGPVVLAGSDINYRVTINIDSDRIAYPNSLSSAIGSFNGEIQPGNQSNPPLGVTLNNVPFGTHEFCTRVNLDPDNYPEQDLTNNEECIEYTLPAPKPQMEVSVEEDVVTAGDTTVVNWSTDTNYELACEVSGLGISESFVTSAPYSDSAPTAIINNAAQYTLDCTATETGENFTEITTVEVIPRIEEI